MNQMTQIEHQAHDEMASLLDTPENTEAVVEFLRRTTETPPLTEEMQAYAAAIRERMAFSIDTARYTLPVVDIVGVGGDKAQIGGNTFPISTTSEFFLAATGLALALKYGNRKASAVSGSMDLLEGLELKVEELSQEDIEIQLAQHGFSPVPARSVHPGAKNVAAGRTLFNQSSDKPSLLFNVLFATNSPAIGRETVVFGCSTPEQMQLAANVFAGQPEKTCLIVRGRDGTDEISTSGDGKTDYILVQKGEVSRGVLDCQEVLGIAPSNIQKLLVTSQEDAVASVRAVIDRDDPEKPDQRIMAMRNAAVGNAAIALYLALHNGQKDFRGVRPYVEIVQRAHEAGKVKQLVEDLSHA